MAEKQPAGTAKVGARKGQGPPPGYLWSVVYLDLVAKEAKRFLDASKYEHVIDQVRALAREESPSHPQTVSVREISDLLELREKGGPLGRTNVRIFFQLDKRDPQDPKIVLVGAIKKEADGQTPPATVRIMTRRFTRYMRGEFQSDTTDGAQK